MKVISLIVGISCCPLCFVMAKKRNRRAIRWGAAGLLFGLIAVIILALLPAKDVD